MKVAIYARCSTNDQSPEMQLHALREYCAARKLTIYKEYIDNGVSGSKDSRPCLNQLMEDAGKRKFDAVLVYRFDRFARSSKHLITALESFNALGIGFMSYSENIDTNSPIGKAVFVIVGAMAELERNIIRERVLAGLSNARAKGKRLGRPVKPYKQSEIISLKASGASTRTIAKALGISNATVSRVLQTPQETYPPTV